jgi:hypothetical protein
VEEEVRGLAAQWKTEASAWEESGNLHISIDEAQCLFGRTSGVFIRSGGAPADLMHGVGKGMQHIRRILLDASSSSSRSAAASTSSPSCPWVFSMCGTDPDLDNRLAEVSPTGTMVNGRFVSAKSISPTTYVTLNDMLDLSLHEYLVDGGGVVPDDFRLLSELSGRPRWFFEIFWTYFVRKLRTGATLTKDALRAALEEAAEHGAERMSDIWKHWMRAERDRETTVGVIRRVLFATEGDTPAGALLDAMRQGLLVLAEEAPQSNGCALGTAPAAASVRSARGRTTTTAAAALAPLSHFRERMLPRTEPLVMTSLSRLIGQGTIWRTLATTLSEASSHSAGEAGQICEQVTAGVLLGTGATDAGVTLGVACQNLAVPGYVVPASVEHLNLCVTSLVSGAATGIQALADVNGALRREVAVVNIANQCGADAAAVFADNATMPPQPWLALVQDKTGKEAKFLNALLTTDPWRQYEPTADRARESHSISPFCRRLRAAHHAFLGSAQIAGTLRIIMHGGGFAPSLVARVNRFNTNHPTCPIVLLSLTDTERYAEFAQTMRALGAMADDGSSEEQWRLRPPLLDAAAAGARVKGKQGGRSRSKK